MTTPPFTTPQAVESLRPNIHVFPSCDLIPDALIIRGTTQVATIEGDEPIVRAPFIEVGEAGFVPEGDEIPDAGVDSREAIIATGKVAILTEVSREQYRQDGVSTLLSDELKRAMIVKADTALLSQAAPTAPAITPPAGLLVQDHTEGGEITNDLDPVMDAIAQIESHSGTADLVIASPLSSAAVDKLKEADGSNKSLLGDGSEATERRLKGLPVAATVPDDLLLVIDRRAILSAYGSLQLAVSDQVGFRKDTIVTRLTWRIGAVIAQPERVVELHVGGGAAAKKAPAKG